MRSPSALLRSLSSRIPTRLLSSPAAVTPLPSRSRFDHLVTSELDTLLILQAGSAGYTSSLTFVVEALAASAAAQKIALDCIAKAKAKANVGCSWSRDDRSAIDEYLEDSAELLDACRDLSATVEEIHKYVESLQVVLHPLLHGHGRFPPTTAARARASRVLDSSTSSCRHHHHHQAAAAKAMETNMKRLIQKLTHGYGHGHGTELGEILEGSSALASTACQILGMALSFKSSKLAGFRPATTSSGGWSTSLHELHKGLEDEIKKTRKSGGFLMLSELRETIMAAQELRIQIKNNNEDLGLIVEELKRKCEGLEQGIRALDEKVDDLYRHLISLRMALLGMEILSQR